MCTGLVTDVGTISKAEDRNGLKRFQLECSYDPGSIEMGASILHAGVCLTVVEHGAREDGSWFVADAVPETLDMTVLGDLRECEQINLEH